MNLIFPAAFYKMRGRNHRGASAQPERKTRVNLACSVSCTALLAYTTTNQNKTVFGEHPAVEYFVHTVNISCIFCKPSHSTMPRVSEQSQALQAIETAIEVTTWVYALAPLFKQEDELREDFKDL